jgi:hypothetical protein
MPPVAGEQDAGKILVHAGVGFSPEIVLAPIQIYLYTKVKRMDTIDTFVYIFVLTLPAYILPLIAGPLILVFFRKDPLARLAAFFTLKPIIATPVWILLYQLTLSVHYIYHTFAFYLATLLPGFLITLILVYGYRFLFRSSPVFFSLLIGLDVVRWSYTFFLFLPVLGFSPVELVEGPWFTVALVFPNLYAAMALILVFGRFRRNRA